MEQEYKDFLKHNSEKKQDFKTNCNGCVFAEYIDNEQTGCKLNRLEKIAKNFKIEKIEDNKFYTINTLCKTYRTESWSKNKNDLIEAVQEEIKLNFTFIITPKKYDDLRQRLQKTITQIIEQDIKPSSIILILNSANIDYKSTYSTLSDIIGKDSGIDYKLVKVIDGEKDDCLDVGVQKCKTAYCTVLDMSIDIPKDFTYKINHMVNEEIRPVVVVKVDNNNFAFQTVMYRILRGNKFANFLDKIEKLSEIQENKKSLVAWESINE